MGMHETLRKFDQARQSSFPNFRSTLTDLEKVCRLDMHSGVRGVIGVVSR